MKKKGESTLDLFMQHQLKNNWTKISLPQNHKKKPPKKEIER